PRPDRDCPGVVMLRLQSTLVVFAWVALLVVLPRDSACGQASKPQLDNFGDPLPEHALARLGSTRFRHGPAIVALALGPDGKAVISSSYGQTLRLWDVATGKELRRFQGHERYVAALALSPDGKTLATVEARGNVIRLWDVATAKAVRQLKLPG